MMIWFKSETFHRSHIACSTVIDDADTVSRYLTISITPNAQPWWVNNLAAYNVKNGNTSLGFFVSVAFHLPAALNSHSMNSPLDYQLLDYRYRFSSCSLPDQYGTMGTGKRVIYTMTMTYNQRYAMLPQIIISSWSCCPLITG